VTVALYNQVRETILDVEYPLIQTQLAQIDTQLEKAISQLNWTSEGTVHKHHSRGNYMHDYTGAWEYIEATRNIVCDMERRVRLAKGNVESMVSVMGGWCQTPLYRRREDKKEQSLLNLEVRQNRCREIGDSSSFPIGS
jgi:dynein heavy chain